MPAASTFITIPAWANGPDGSGNGGWSAGLLAAVLADREAVGVDLRVPPPIGRPLRVGATDDGAEAWDDDGDEPVLVARAAGVALPLDAPPEVRGVDLDAADAATAGFPFRDRHPFPRCISCGTERADEVPSLHLWAGPVDDVTTRDDDGATVPVFATPWTPGADIGDEDGAATLAACWSALDCPSATPVADAGAANPAVLARMEARVDRRPGVGERCVVTAWRRAVDGRKRWTGSALVGADGELLGVARALWIEVRPR